MQLVHKLIYIITKNTVHATPRSLYYFGLHFALLEEAGLKMEWSDVFGCSKRHEDPGCLDEMYGFPCGEFLDLMIRHDSIGNSAAKLSMFDRSLVLFRI